MNQKIELGDSVKRRDLKSPHTYVVKAIESEYVTIARYENRKPWFTLVKPEQLQKVGNAI